MHLKRLKDNLLPLVTRAAIQETEDDQTLDTSVKTLSKLAILRQLDGEGLLEAAETVDLMLEETDDVSLTARRRLEALSDK